MHNTSFFFSYKDLETSKEELLAGPFTNIGYRKGNIEIRLMQFTTGKDHKSANKAVVQLGPFGWYDTEFKTQIVIMGGYLVVLLAHYEFLNDTEHTARLAARATIDSTPRKYQTEYFVDWVKGHIIHVRTPPITFETVFELPVSFVETGR